MKTIVILSTAVVAGAVRQSIEGPIVVSKDDEADRLIENGLAEEVVEEAADEDEG